MIKQNQHTHKSGRFCKGRRNLIEFSILKGVRIESSYTLRVDSSRVLDFEVLVMLMFLIFCLGKQLIGCYFLLSYC